jgi:cytochrome d ubiquinol oxidase subunit I
MDALAWHRFQFGFTVAFHYLFPPLTMGLALVIVLLKGLALRTGEARYSEAARFWAKIFGINFALGVVTGIPMEFQFGTNWGRFSNVAGGIIGTTLAMEGMFAFVLESTFLGLFLFGEKRLGPKGHFGAALALFLGSWLSGYFIIVTNAFMQHPVGHAIGPDGRIHLADLAVYLTNPWAFWQYLHNQSAAVITAAFVVAAIGAYWTLARTHEEHGLLALKVGVTLGLIASVLQIFPTGDMHGKMVAKHQPAALAAMEGHFESGSHAPLAIIGQPDRETRTLKNPMVVPGLLSYLIYGTFGGEVPGLDSFPEEQWPDNVELLYFCYHIMAGLGTFFILVMGVAAILLWRGRLQRARWMLWVLMCAFPFPYIANIAGWMTAELGRQPWLVYGLMRTRDGTSPQVSGGDVAFSALGFMGIYLAIGLLCIYVMMRAVGRGPVPTPAPILIGDETAAAAKTVGAGQE